MAPTTPSTSRLTYRDIKLPAYSDDLEPWLTLVEAVLQNTSDSLSDQERYGAILAALPVTKVKDVEHVLLNPARSNKYAALVAALKKTIPKQSDEKTFSLLLTMQLGDREPSRLYEEMTRINTRRTAKLPTAVIRSQHLQKMPLSQQALIEATTYDKNDDQYAEVADRVLHRYRTCQTASQIHSVAYPELSVNEVSLVKRISELELQVKQLTSQVRDNNRSPGRQIRQDDMCYYHSRFDDQARNCRPHCKYNQTQQSARQRQPPAQQMPPTACNAVHLRPEPHLAVQSRSCHISTSTQHDNLNWRGNFNRGHQDRQQNTTRSARATRPPARFQVNDCSLQQRWGPCSDHSSVPTIANSYRPLCNAIAAITAQHSCGFTPRRNTMERVATDTCNHTRPKVPTYLRSA